MVPSRISIFFQIPKCPMVFFPPTPGPLCKIAIWKSPSSSSDFFRGEEISVILLIAEILHHLGCINLVNNGINDQPQLVNAGFQPSTVWKIRNCSVTRQWPILTVPAWWKIFSFEVHEKSGYPGCLGFFGGWKTTQVYRDYNKALEGSLLNN